MLKAGFKTDIAHPCSDNVQRWRDAELLKPVDTTRLQHWPDVFPHLKELEGTHFQGEPWFVPFDWGNSSVLYRADLVDIEEDSWGLLYDERYKNRLAFLNSAEAAVEVAALVLGYDNIFTLTDDQLTEVKKLILQQRQLLRFYWQDPADIEKGLASGELVAAYGWNSSVAALKEQGVPVKYMNPKEGILTWVCGLVFLRASPGSEQATYDLVDSMLSPEAGRFLIEAYGYGHSNTKSFELASGERLDALSISAPEALFSQAIFFREVGPEYMDKYNDLFDFFQAAAPDICTSQICQESCEGRCINCERCAQ